MMLEGAALSCFLENAACHLLMLGQKCSSSAMLARYYMHTLHLHIAQLTLGFRVKSHT